MKLETLVADTSALVSLAVPRADTDYDTQTDPDPLQYLLTSCDVFLPPEVRTELQDLSQYEDIHAVAATNVLAASDYYTIKDPYAHSAAPDSRPTYGLDAGETDGIVLANTLTVDGFLTDEFGGGNFPLIHAVLETPRIVPTPRLICDYARNDHMTAQEAATVLENMSHHRSWGNSSYVNQIQSMLNGV